MKKRMILLLAVSTVFVFAFRIKPTGAFYTDWDISGAGKTTAGYLEIDMEAELSGYGVPGDVQELGAVRIANVGGIDIEYELRLFVAAEAAQLLDAGKGAVILSEAGTQLDTNLLCNETDGSITLVYYGNIKADEPQQAFDVSLAFKGAELIDGNDYQNHPVTITYEVYAYQPGHGTGGGEQ